MNAAFAIVLALFGVTQLWTEPGHVAVFPDSTPGPGASRAVRLYAARGERESFQICIRPGKKGLEEVEVRAPGLDESIGPPEVHRVGFLRLGGSLDVDGVLWPDPLLTPAPFEAPPNETQAVWLTYAVPESASPGLHYGKVAVASKKGRTWAFDVTIEVFDFVLPETPTLQAVFPLCRRAVRDVYGIDDTDLEAWKPIYGAFAGYRLALGLWDGGDLVKIQTSGEVDATALKEHLAYIVSTAHLSAAPLGPGPEGLTVFPRPLPGAVQDPLQCYLGAMGDYLEECGRLERACFQPMSISERRRWPEARAACERVRRADGRIRRILVGGMHPFLERYTDIWAVPLRFTDPLAIARLEAGLSVAAKAPYRAIDIVASSSGGPSDLSPFASAPEDAYDGALVTYWVSDAEPSRKAPQWLQIALAERVRTNRIRVGWQTGLESDEVRVRTSYEGESFSIADVSWEHHPAHAPYERSWSEGRFKRDKAFTAIRLEFLKSTSGGPVGISEVELGKPPVPDSVGKIEPVEVWLSTREGDFPSLAAGGQPMESRLLPWVCWACRARGFTHDALNRWPGAWVNAAKEQPPIWTATEGEMDAFLFYPGSASAIPSIRAELLRDGIEDFEYLSAVSDALESGVISDPSTGRYCARLVYSPERSRANMDELSRRVIEGRVAMGRALTDLARE